MAKELYVTPLAEVRWCKLVGNARPNTFDPSKPNQWTAELVLDNANKTHSAWLVEMEDQHAPLARAGLIGAVVWAFFQFGFLTATKL